MTKVKTQKIYNQLKKQNGEKVAQAVRDAGLWDIPNIVHVLEFAGKNEDEVKNLFPVIREIYKTQKDSEYYSDKDPLELLNDAGYDAFIVTTEAQKDSIIKYYRPGEELCTFRDPHRHEKYYMIHAIKRNADKIKPSDQPERQDEYGTSVISIQIAKTGGFISIKNRYNHSVDNPDATFDSNPDKIIRGLSNSLKKYFNVEFNVSQAVLPHNFRMVNDQIVRFNHEINNVYFGDTYYFSGSEIVKLNNDYEYMLDYFILNSKTKELIDLANTEDYTFRIFKELFHNKTIKVEKNPENKNEKQIFVNGIYVASLKNGQITGLNLLDIKNIESYFMTHNTALKTLHAPNLEKVGDDFLIANNALTEVNLPNIKIIGDQFLARNKILKKFHAPKLEKIGISFLHDNINLVELKLPELQSLDGSFLPKNEKLQRLVLPKLKEIGNNFLANNDDLSEVDLPNVTKIGTNFLAYNNKLKILALPNLERFGSDFLHINETLEELYLPKTKNIDDDFLKNNKHLKILYAPELKQIGNNFLRSNKLLQELDLPDVETIGNKFLFLNTTLKKLNTPKLHQISFDFLYYNNALEELDLPHVKDIYDLFMPQNMTLKKFNAPELEIIGNRFLEANNTLIEFNAPKLKQIGNDFLYNNKTLTTLELPEVNTIASNFMQKNNQLKRLFLPKLTSLGSDSLSSASPEMYLYVPNLPQNHIPNRLRPNLDVYNVASTRIRNKMKELDIKYLTELHQHISKAV